MPAKIKAWLVFQGGEAGYEPAGTGFSSEAAARSRELFVRQNGGRARLVSVELDESELLPRPGDEPKVKVELR